MPAERKPLKRTPMKRGGKGLKRTPINPKPRPLHDEVSPGEEDDASLSDERRERGGAKPRKPMKRVPFKTASAPPSAHAKPRKPLERSRTTADESAPKAPAKPRKPMKRGGSELKRTPLSRGEKGLKQTPSAKPRKALNPMSEQRKEENKIRRERMLEKFGPRETWKCQIGHLIGTPCFGEVNGHEPKARSAGGSITDMNNVMLACNHHNEWVESHSKKAHALGLKKWSWED